jgi:sodium-dependent dicarboxylate transporter 2/3/5
MFQRVVPRWQRKRSTAATLACSYAFMLPVATPPNAIVFASERLTIRDMVRRGMPLNFVAVILVTLAVYLLGPVTLGIGE